MLGHVIYFAEWFGEFEIHEPMTLKILSSNFVAFLLYLNNFFTLCEAYIDLRNKSFIKSAFKLFKFWKAEVANILDSVTSIVDFLGVLSIINYIYPENHFEHLF